MVNSNNKNPKVSVVIPVYNGENYLNECIDSIINQTLKDIEIICVNDGSTDNSLNILKEYAKKDNRIIILDEPNEGAGISRKKGINVSKGEYIFLSDSDDILKSNLLELTYKNGINNKSDIVFFKVKYFNTKINHEFIPKKFDLSDLFPPNTDFDNLAFDWSSIKPVVLNRFANIWCCLFNGDFLRDNDFCFPKRLSFNDVPLHVQSIILSKRISFVPEVLYEYRLYNETSITFKTHKNRKVFNIFKITEIIESFLEKENLLNVFRLELINFKIDHQFYHLNTIKDSDLQDEFLEQMKSGFKKINITENEFNKLSNHFKKIFISVCVSNSYSEFKNKKKELDATNVIKFNEINNSKISIILPIYYDNNNLINCLNSLINQTFNGLEILCIINANLVKNSFKIIEEYGLIDDRIKIIKTTDKNEEFKIIGVNKSSASYVHFIETNYIFPENFYELLYNEIKDNNYDVLLSKLNKYDELSKENITNSNSKMIFESFDTKFDDKKFKELLFLFDSDLISVIFKKECIDDLDIYSELIYYDLLIFTEFILKSENMGMTKESVIFLTDYSNFNNRLSIIFVVNQIIEKFKIQNYYGIYKCDLLNFKLKQILESYQKLELNFKASFFNNIKKDFKMISNDESLYLDYETYLNENLKIFFDTVLISETYKELDLHCKINNLSQKISILENENELYKIQHENLIDHVNFNETESCQTISFYEKKVNQLNNDIVVLKKINSELINSNSNLNKNIDLLRAQNKYLTKDLKKDKIIKNDSDLLKKINYSFKNIFK